MDKRCRDCFYWSYDMDMDDFCVHPNASSMGTDTNAMRSTRKLQHTRGPNCGPSAVFFKPSKVRKPVQYGKHPDPSPSGVEESK